MNLQVKQFSYKSHFWVTLGSSLNLSELVSLSGKQLVILDFRTYLRVRKDSLLKTPGITCYMLAHRRCSDTLTESVQLPSWSGPALYINKVQVKYNRLPVLTSQMVFYHLCLSLLGWVSLGLLNKTMKPVTPVKAGNGEVFPWWISPCIFLSSLLSQL